jgi:hypothetical protein
MLRQKKAPYWPSVIIPFILLTCHSSHKDIEQLKAHYVFANGLYVENDFADPQDEDRFTDDNEIYAVYRKFVYDYYVIKDGDTLKMTAPVHVEPNAEYQRVWNLVPATKGDADMISTLALTVVSGISNEHQTSLQYDYHYRFDPGFVPFRSTSGVIENGMNIWMHPHRDKYFQILELNPFPFIQQPFETGHKWTWSLEIGDYWKDKRWKEWSGSITNTYQYEIIGKELLRTKIGDLECWVVEGVAQSEIGATGLISYFNEQYGFVKMDFINIDKSKVTMELISAE